MISPEIAINNRTPIQALNQGDLIMAGGFPVKLTKVTGGGSFSGEGYVTIPMLGQVNVKVRFSGIQVNTERQLFGGVIETTYDPNEKQITNLDKIIEGGDGTGIVITGKNYADYEVDFPIKGVDNIRPVFKDKDGNVIPEGSTTPAASATITVSDGAGKTKTIEAEKIPTTIKDSEGTVYKVEQGTDGKPKVSKVSESVPMQMTVAELNKLNSDRGTVSFVAHPKQQYAFDAYRAEYGKSKVLGVDVYQKLNDNYFVNAKAILQGKTDLVKATIALKDNSLKADSVQFVTGKGVKLTKNKLEGNDYEITLVGGPANDAQELFAVYPLGNGKYLSLGKLLISSYQPKTVKVQLVPVMVKGKETPAIDENAISKSLNEIYGKIGINFTVSKAASFENESWDINGDKSLAVSGSGLLSTQTAEMKALNSAYKVANPSLAKDVAVLFMLNSSDSTATLKGDMPRGKQFGYLFSSADGNTAAHEIGHGVFKLEHTFSKYGLNKDDLKGNMMNYPAGDGLIKFQWDAIHAPGIVVGVFESDEDGQSDNVAIEKLIAWLKTNKDKESEFKKYDYFESHAWVDVAQTAVDINGKPFTVYVELGDNGIVDFRPNSEGLFKNYGIAIHYEGKYASKYHTGFSLKVKYADRADAAIVFWTYSFTDYEKLLNKIGIALTEPAKDNIYNQYTKELTNAGKDPDKLDMLFENIPPFVLVRLTKEQRWDYLTILAKETLTGRSFGTSEEEAVVNILKSFNGEWKWLYDKLYNNREIVENIYKELQGDNLLVALEVFRQAAEASGKNVDGASKYIFIGSAGETYKDNSFLYGYPYLLTSESGWNEDHNIKLDCVIARPNIIPTNWGSVEVRKQINQVPYINPLELIKVYMDEPSNEEWLPAIYALRLGAIKNRTELMGAIGKAANILATATSGKILFSGGSSSVMRVLATLQLAKTGLDIAMADPAVQRELDNSEEGKWLKQKWPTISLATDITLLGSDIIAGLAKNGTKAANQIRKIKNGEFNEAADNLDNLAIEAKGLNRAGNIAQYAGKSTKGIKNILPLESPIGLFRQLKGTNGQTHRAATFWTDEGADMMHYVSQDAKYYIKHDPNNGRVLFIDAQSNKFMGFMLDQDNIIGTNYSTLVENLKTIHGLPNSVRTVNVKGAAITFADDKANLVLGKYKPNNSPGISGEIGTDDIIDQMTILKNYSFADKSFELRNGSVHVLNIPDGNIAGVDDFFDTFNKDILDLAVNNSGKVKVNLVSDPRKPALLNYYNSVENKFSGYPTTFAKEIKYLREHGVKTVYLKDGTSINLDNIQLNNLNWTGWKY